MKHGLPRQLVVAAVAVVAIVAGCGGSGSTSASTASAAAPAPAATAATSDTGTGTDAGGTPSAEATAETVVTEPPAGGGTAADVCGLVTADELKGVFGVSGVKQTVIPGPPDNCIVESDTGDALTAWSLTTAQSGVIFGAMTTDPSTVEVPGIGDKAAIVQNTGLLVLKGSSLFSVSISGGSDMSEDEVVEASKQIASFAAGRL